MRKGWQWKRSLLAPAAIFISFSLSALHGFAQDTFFDRDFFSLQTDLFPSASELPLGEAFWLKSSLHPGEERNIAALPRSPEIGTGEKPEKWALFTRGGFVFSLSTMRDPLLRFDISRPGMDEPGRLERDRSWTSHFFDLPSGDSLQYFGEMFQPELQLGIEF